MIALQSLKYKIFEWCLDTLVDKLSRNLILTPLNASGLIRVEDLRIGMFLSRIELCDGSDNNWDIFRDCEIVNILNNDNNYDVKFTYGGIIKTGTNLQFNDINEENKDQYSGCSVTWNMDSKNQIDSRFYL